ncbi:hypothetical protein SynBIOSE41_03682 [Synechococcus sp. BIOS-E4-1]|uniref:hypothetical protein n=1 Tax=Synechococcus sp. BIOS-E4-1 TaxID=1400864 RepID=UPI001644929F|nr:hypothetical protein [Synechococcus sp. BIOS-E4-1]QNI56151.1 hypothetical protein SynBIOSE41_03682 [Synechococcus sp. BIOS-E4-1]
MKESTKKLDLISVLKKAFALLSQHALMSVVCVLLLLSSPTQSKADIQKYNIVTDEFYGLNAERILLVPVADAADKTVRMTGKCKSRGATELYLEDDPVNARERWYVLTKNDSTKADQEICLTGNLPAWFEKLSFLR